MDIELSEGIYLAGMVIGIMIRIRYTSDPVSRSIRGTSILEIALLVLVAIGMFILPPVSILTRWFACLEYNLTNIAIVIGACLHVASLILMWRSHRDLGRNWTPALGLRDDHLLVTSGTYGTIRHPMYLAHWLWAFAQPLLVHNLIGGWMTLAFFTPLYMTRTGREERMMLDRFGDEYLEYSKRTGRLLPRRFK